MPLIIGNVIALVAALLMVYSGVIRKKKKVLYVQSIQIGLYVISNIILGGISGTIINAISFVRNVLCYKNRLGIIEKIVITILVVGLTIYFNNLGIIGLLPLVSTVVYLWLMTIKDVRMFKVLVIFTMVLWGIYDFTIKSYTSFVFEVLTIVANIYSIIKISSKENKT